MEDIFIIKIVFGIMLTIGSIVLFFITFKLWFKYLIQQKKCTAITNGVVARYSFASRSSVHLPIVHYYVDEKKYKVLGPEYKRIVHTNKSSILGENEMNYEEKGHSFYIYRSSNFMVGIFQNPMKELYPLQSNIPVYYSPNRPKLAYVKRYCDKRWAFWVGLSGGMICLLLDIYVLFLL